MNQEKKVVELEIDDILPNRFQPRFKFQEQAITELAESIREHGVINPILVRQLGDKFEIIAGERRYKASVLAGKETIPAIVTDLNDKESAEVALIENVQRQDLTPIEEAVSYRKILDMGYLTQEQLAEKLGKTQSTISNKLRLLNLNDAVQEALLDSRISERHARSLLKLNNKAQQKEVLDKIISQRLTVKKTDDLISEMLRGPVGGPIPEPAIQSSSAVELIEPQSQNAFNPSQTNDEEMLSFLNTNKEPQQVIAPIPEEEIPIIPISQINGFNINNKPDSVISAPILDTDTSEIQPVQTIPEEVKPTSELDRISQNNEKELLEINQMLDQIPSKINPGFVDVDYIEQNAKDINVELPTNSNVIMPDIPQNHTEINMQMDTSFEPQNPIEQDYKQNKFFNFVAPDETPTEPTNPEEIFNLKPQIESANQMTDFLSQNPTVEAKLDQSEELKSEIKPEEKKEEPKQDEIKAFDIFNPPTIEHTTPEPVQTSSIESIPTSSVESIPTSSLENITSVAPQPEKIDDLTDIQEVKTFDIFNAPSVDQPKTENLDTNLNLNEFYNTDEIQEINEGPKVFNYPQDNLAATAINDKQTILTQDTAKEEAAPVTLKTAIDTIRKCSDTIEQYGFTIETEEFDLDDMYQVIFRIKK